MELLDSIKLFLEDNSVDVDLILSVDLGIELIQDLTNEYQFVQGLRRVDNVITEVIKAQDEAIHISRLITSNGDSVFFVFPVDERKVGNDHLILDERVSEYLNLRLLDKVENKYILSKEDSEEEEEIERDYFFFNSEENDECEERYFFFDSCNEESEEDEECEEEEETEEDLKKKFVSLFLYN